MSEIVLSFIQILLLLSIFCVVFFFVRPVFWGAPYAPSDDGKIKRMLDMAHVSKGDRSVDVGSGDGRIVLALVEKGAYATGYEINPVLCLVSNIRIWQKGLQGSARVYRKNFWKADFSKYDVIVVFGVTYIMPALEEKLLRELRPGARVVSNHFSFPTWTPKSSDRGVYLYVKN